MKRFSFYIFLLLLITCAKDSTEDNSSVYVAPPTNTVNPTPTPTVTQYTLTVAAGEGGSVSTTGGTYNDGTSLSISASANEGYSFTGWSNGSSDNPLNLILNSNTSVIANFLVDYSFNEIEIINSLNSVENRLPYLFKNIIWEDFVQEGYVIIDYNNDGYLDLVHSDIDYYNSIQGNRVRNYIKFYLGDADGYLTEDSSNMNKFEGLIHNRKSISGDWNGDGWIDIFFAGTGPDSQQPNYIPNEYPIMLLNDMQGSFLEYRLNNQYGITDGYFHSVTSSDIDNDGLSEVLLIEPKSDLLEQSRIIEFEGNTGGNWGNGLKISPIDIEEEDVINKFTSESIDLDGNGTIELLLGGEQSFNGSFVYDLTTKTKRYIPHKKDLLIDAIFFDIDDDGDLDIIASTNNTYYEGMIEIFRNDIDAFTDVTDQFIDINYDYQNHNQQWILWLYIGDFNNDGIIELHTSDSKDFDGIQTTDIWWFENQKFIKK